MLGEDATRSSHRAADDSTCSCRCRQRTKDQRLPRLAFFASTSGAWETVPGSTQGRPCSPWTCFAVQRQVSSSRETMSDALHLSIVRRKSDSAGVECGAPLALWGAICGPGDGANKLRGHLQQAYGVGCDGATFDGAGARRSLRLCDGTRGRHVAGGGWPRGARAARALVQGSGSWRADRRM